MDKVPGSARDHSHLKPQKSQDLKPVPALQRLLGAFLGQAVAPRHSVFAKDSDRKRCLGWRRLTAMKGIESVLINIPLNRRIGTILFATFGVWRMNATHMLLLALTESACLLYFRAVQRVCPLVSPADPH